MPLLFLVLHSPVLSTRFPFAVSSVAHLQFLFVLNRQKLPIHSFHIGLTICIKAVLIHLISLPQCTRVCFFQQPAYMPALLVPSYNSCKHVPYIFSILPVYFYYTSFIQNAHGWAGNKTEASLCNKLAVKPEYTDVHHQNGHGCPWFHAVAIFWLCQNSRPRIDKEVNSWTALWDCSDSLFAVCFKQQQLLQ